MEKEEKIRKVYTKYGIDVEDETVELILEDEERANEIIRIYKQEEMDSMNYILGKPEDNRVFTVFELEAVNKIDLFNRKVVEICKLIWENKNNLEQREQIEKAGEQNANN